MVVVGHVAMGEIVTELKRILPEVHLTVNTVNSETRTSNQVFELRDISTPKKPRRSRRWKLGKPSRV